MIASRFTIRHLAIALGIFLLLLASVWIAIQGGIVPVSLPDQTLDQTLLQIQGKLAGVLYWHFTALTPLVVFWIGALGWGWWIQERLLPLHRARVVLRLGLGLGVMLLLAWTLGVLGLLNRWTAWFPAVAGAMFAAWYLADRQKRGKLEIDRWAPPPWTFAFCIPIIALILVAAICPPGSLWRVEAFGYDTLSYHLQLPREWLLLGRISPLRHNVYSYLPNLVEAGYMQLIAMQGDTPQVVYLCQIWHATTAFLAATCLAMIVSRWVGSASACLAAVCFLAAPWTIITASSAYNESAALALVLTALLLLLEQTPPSRCVCFLAGALLALASLAKLTIGLLCLPPIALLLFFASKPGLLFSSPQPPASSALPPAQPCLLQSKSGFSIYPPLLLLLGCFLFLLPYLLRNYVWTGNPVFPFAATTLGAAHWEPWQIEAWRKSSSIDQRWAGALPMLYQRWFASTGYGNVLGSPPSSTLAFDITRFHREGGFPTLWIALLITLISALLWSAARRLTLALLLMLLLQLLLWIAFTHQQSRFLLPTLIPVCIIIGLGAGRLGQGLRVRSNWLRPMLAFTLVFLLTANAYSVFFHQTRDLPLQGRMYYTPPYRCLDILPQEADPQLIAQVGQIVGDHVINYLPPDSRTLLIADATPFYLRGAIHYHTAFDRSPLGETMRTLGPAATPAQITSHLKSRGYTHVWVNWSELERLSATYGYDPAVTFPQVQSLASTWILQSHFNWGTLFHLP